LCPFQIDPNDIHQACSNCLVKLDDFRTFCSTIRNSICGFVDLFKNIIVSDDERPETAESVACESIKDEFDYNDGPDPFTEEATDQILEAFSCEDKVELLKPEIRVETLEEKIQRIMADSSDDEMNYVIETLEEPTPRTPKSRPVFSCETCGKTFGKLSRKERHVLTHTDQKMYACSHEGCDRRFKSKLSHREHESSHTGDYPMYCSFGCGRGFHLKKNKDNHEAVHSDERPFQCELCDKRYILKRALEDHYRRQHVSNLAASIPCEICGKLFRLKAALTSHLRTHSDERRFKCKLCPLAYKHSSHLRDHEKTHQEAQHFCPLCDAKFVLKQSLK
jgi:Zinc finger, C2H2 type